MVPLCPKCHQQVRPTDYFCYNCGTNLHAKPLSTSLTQQLVYYSGSIVLPPMGIIWGMRYLRESHIKSKVVGIVCIVLTIIELVFIVQVTVNLIHTINIQMTEGLNKYQGF